MSVLPLRLGIAGLGTVGGGVVRLVSEQSDLLQARCGRPIQVAAVSALDQHKDRGLDLSAFDWHDDPVVMAGSDAIDVFIELIGGEDGPAKVAVEAITTRCNHIPGLGEFSPQILGYLQMSFTLDLGVSDDPDDSLPQVITSR